MWKRVCQSQWTKGEEKKIVVVLKSHGCVGTMSLRIPKQYVKLFNSIHSQGHMKHHGVATKTTRPPARSSRSSSDQPPSSTSMTSLNIPATRSSSGFWNQYQAFLNTSAEPSDDRTIGAAPGSQGDNDTAPRSAKSPARSQMDPRGPEEMKEESKME